LHLKILAGLSDGVLLSDLLVHLVNSGESQQATGSEEQREEGEGFEQGVVGFLLEFVDSSSEGESIEVGIPDAVES